MSRLSDRLCDYEPQFQEPLVRLREAESLVLMVLAAWEVVRRLAVRWLYGRPAYTCPLLR